MGTFSSWTCISSTEQCLQCCQSITDCLSTTTGFRVNFNSIFPLTHLYIHSFYSASWSALGDAHLHSNNIKTALSCYSKASALERETLYSLTRQAFAQTLLGRYNEAIALFDKVIDQAPKYLLARKGLFIHPAAFFNK